MVPSVAGGEGKCNGGVCWQKDVVFLHDLESCWLFFSHFHHGWRFTSNHVVLKDYNKKLSDDVVFVMEFQHSQQELKAEATCKGKKK